MYVIRIERDGDSRTSFYDDFEDARMTARYWEGEGYTAVIFDEDDNVVYATGWN